VTALTDTSAPRGLAARHHARLRGAWGDSLLRNSVLIMANTVVTSLLGYVYWLVAARLFDTATVGLASAVIGLMTITAIVANVGVAGALVQRLPGRARGAEWSTSLSAGIVGAGVAGTVGGLAVIGVLALAGSGLDVVHGSLAFAAVFVLGVCSWALSMVLDYTFIAERSSGHMLVRGTLMGVLKIPLLALAAAGGATALGLFGSWVGATVLAAAVGLAVQVPRMGKAFRFRLAVRRELRAMGRSVAGNHLISIGNVLPVYLLPTLIVSRLDAADGAFFYMTWMLGGAFFMISSAIGSSLFAEGSNEPEALRARMRSAAKLVALLLTPAMLVMLIAGDRVLGVFGADYAAAGSTLLVLLTLSAVPDAITNLSVARLRVERRLGFAGALTIGMALTALAGSWLLLPSLGIAGAGWAWLGAQSLGSVAVAVDALARRARTVPTA
jgi:O-antigen/teichoic acid export membrane protein